ncbi:MAG: hypothetical protein SW833_19725 [Cyanobacteriota bacterium]|nr:hypothetical protein [Cyanobacteriota bacterium]
MLHKAKTRLINARSGVLGLLKNQKLKIKYNSPLLPLLPLLPISPSPHRPNFALNKNKTFILVSFLNKAYYIKAREGDLPASSIAFSGGNPSLPICNQLVRSNDVHFTQ